MKEPGLALMDGARSKWQACYPAVAAGGLASLAGIESSEAALVVVEADLNLVPTARASAVGGLDLNSDSIEDLVLVVGAANNPDSVGNTGLVNVAGLGARVAFSGGYPVAFGASELIGSHLSFRDGIGTMAWSSAGLLGSRGNWFGGNDAYLGVQFQVGTDFFYGWIHTVWDPSTNTLSIDETGYEDSGSAIVTPPPPEVPEDFEIAFETEPDPAEVGMRWPVLAGKTYELQRSRDHVTWETIYTVTPSEDGEESFTDRDYPGLDHETKSARAFYRIKQTEASLLLLALGIPRRRREMPPGSDGVTP